MRYLFIVNPIAGMGGKRKIPDLINSAFRNNPADARVLFTRCPGDAKVIVKEYFNEFDVFVAVGGDGTTNEVMSALAGSGKIMGLIPSGSGNALGRELGISMIPSIALKNLLKAEVRQIDTGLVNNEYRFVNVCGFGFDEHIARCFDHAVNRGPVTYISFVVKEFPVYYSNTYTIEIDGEKLTKKAFVLTVANTSQYGNNAFIAPKAVLDDGIFDICIMSPFPVGLAPEMFIRLLNKQLDSSRYCEYYKAKKIVVTGVNLNFQIDGEPIANNYRIEITVDPLSLNILVPKKLKRAVIPQIIPLASQWSGRE
jgi:diacylglycerol kinase (ATP)